MTAVIEGNEIVDFNLYVEDKEKEYFGHLPENPYLKQFVQMILDNTILESGDLIFTNSYGEKKKLNKTVPLEVGFDFNEETFSLDLFPNTTHLEPKGLALSINIKNLAERKGYTNCYKCSKSLHFEERLGWYACVCGERGGIRKLIAQNIQ